MFETETEKHCNEAICSNCGHPREGEGNCGVVCYEWRDEYDTFKEGAEFGYNKANEWQFLKTKDDLPKPRDTRRVLTWYGRNIKEGKPVILDANRFDVDGAVIAWKEIVLPELPKKSE